MRNLRAWLPVPAIRPLSTFPSRSLAKWVLIAKQLFWIIGLRLGFSGAKAIGVTSNGNTILQLNAKSALGQKGALIELPQDQTIFESVRHSGTWEIEESKFLAKSLVAIHQKAGNRTALIDIGANTGLVSLQTMNLAKTENEIFLFEPIPRHAEAIKHNLGHLEKVHVNEFALSNQSGEAVIFTETGNHGNTSLIQDLVPSQGQISTTIKLVETKEYCEKHLLHFNSFIIKCDTQGMDALILSRIPKSIWQRCEASIVEVWALPHVSEDDVDVLLSSFKEFEYVNWIPNSHKRVTLEEVRNFWLSKSSVSRNLFLST